MLKLHSIPQTDRFFFHNIKHICLPTVTFVRNCHNVPARLFAGGKELLSHKGTTHGDPHRKSLLSVVSKIFETLVNKRIVDHLEKCGLFLISSMVLGLLN